MKRAFCRVAVLTLASMFFSHWGVAMDSPTPATTGLHAWIGHPVSAFIAEDHELVKWRDQGGARLFFFRSDSADPPRPDFSHLRPGMNVEWETDEDKHTFTLTAVKKGPGDAPADYVITGSSASSTVRVAPPPGR